MPPNQPVPKVQYHLPILPPIQPELEAYSQEIAALQTRFSGTTNFLNPNQYMPKTVRAKLPLLRVPRLLFGLHQWPQLRQMDQLVDLHQLYNPDPYPYPILRRLTKPVVYVLSGGASEPPPNINYFAHMGAVVVYDEASADVLKSCGLSNVFVARTGIDTQKFTHSPLPVPTETAPNFRLLMASAPWTEAQFATKGIDALLAAACDLPHLYLTFLWRGVLAREMSARVAAARLQDRVTVIDELVDVNQILSTVHATVVLATHADIVKAYPHSLLDSLAAGKPMLLSSALAMADYVAQREVGVVVDAVEGTQVVAAIKELMERYRGLADRAVRVGRDDFSQGAMIDSYAAIYAQVLGNG